MPPAEFQLTLTLQQARRLRPEARARLGRAGSSELPVSNQFAKGVGIAINTSIHSGSGTGQPTGIRNAAGVASAAVDGQGGRQILDSIIKALSRIVQRFETPDAVVMHPRDAVKIDLAVDANGRYVFEEGIARRLPEGFS